jgi:hypothetical protein
VQDEQDDALRALREGVAIGIGFVTHRGDDLIQAGDAVADVALNYLESEGYKIARNPNT